MLYCIFSSCSPPGDCLASTLTVPHQLPGANNGNRGIVIGLGQQVAAPACRSPTAPPNRARIGPCPPRHAARLTSAQKLVCCYDYRLVSSQWPRCQSQSSTDEAVCRASSNGRGRTEPAKAVVDSRKRGPIGHHRLCKTRWRFQRRHSHLIQDQGTYEYLVAAYCVLVTAPSDGCSSSVSIWTTINANA